MSSLIKQSSFPLGSFLKVSLCSSRYRKYYYFSQSYSAQISFNSDSECLVENVLSCQGPLVKADSNLKLLCGSVKDRHNVKFVIISGKFK